MLVEELRISGIQRENRSRVEVHCGICIGVVELVLRQRKRSFVLVDEASLKKK